MKDLFILYGKWLIKNSIESSVEAMNQLKSLLGKKLPSSCVLCGNTKFKESDDANDFNAKFHCSNCGQINAVLEDGFFVEIP